MAENKNANVPVASHGLHKHDYNFPWLSSINFCNVMPCYYNPVRKGERDSPKAGLFSQLMPIAHNAFATGRYNFKAIFVPYKFVWRPWYAFDQSTEYLSNGVPSLPQRYPYVSMSALNTSFYNLMTVPGSQDEYDLIWGDAQATHEYRRVNNDGRVVLRILMALGCTPTFNGGGKETINILPLMCYIKAFADYYFPNQYVGNSYYHRLAKFFDTDTIDFSSETDDLLDALLTCGYTFYDNSIFDNCWDNPISPNMSQLEPSVNVHDITNDSAYHQVVTNDGQGIVSPYGPGTRPSNGTPFVGGNSTGQANATGVITDYVINALKSVSMWAKRHQLSGARLLDRFLVSRGITIGNDDARISYFMGQRNVEIEVSSVENNTNTNLGELAGKGVASSGKDPISFKIRPESDGIFLVIVSAIPDATFPVYRDGFVSRVDYMDNYHAEFDKLGAAAVPAHNVYLTNNGAENLAHQNAVFGFLNQYWSEVEERPRLMGDFFLKSKGSEELAAYHTFRKIPSTLSNAHSYSFIRSGSDYSQYQRLFYSINQENLMLFLRWFGTQYKEKLPLGDSYEWDDDEMNRRVNIVVNGPQK